MNPQRHLPLPVKHIVAVVLVVVCVQFLMEWATVAHRGSAHGDDVVHHATRIAGLPLLVVLVWVITRTHGRFLRGLFASHSLTPKVIATGLLVGLLARLLSWSLITGRAAFGLLPSSAAAAPQSLRWAYECPEPMHLLMAVAVWCALVPLAEEFVYRGVLLSAFAARGPLFAVGSSAMIFTALHPPQAYAFVMAFGIVFGVLFWNARTLWAPILTHATYDGLKIVDSICLELAWNPPPSQIPDVRLGLVCAALVIASGLAIAYLVSSRWIGPDVGTRPTPLS